MAKSCPRDLVRDLVEGVVGQTILGGGRVSGTGAVENVADERVTEVEKHLASCSSCRSFRRELEEEEKLVRASVALFGDRETPETGEPAEGDACPVEAQLAAFADGSLEGNLHARLEAHIASCALCRASLVAASAPVMVEVRDDVLAVARRRLAVARSTPVVARSDSRRTSARRKSGSRTGKYAPITPMPARPNHGLGLLVAAAAAVLVAVGLFAFRDTSDRSNDTVAQHESPVPAPVKSVNPQVAPEPTGSSAPLPTAPRPLESVAPVAPSSAPETAPAPESPVVAVASPSDDEEDPAEEDEAPRGPRGVGPANSGRPDSTAQPGARPSSPAPATPGRHEQGPVLGEKIKPGTLACAVASLDGSVEIRKKDQKSWRVLSLADTVDEGDAVRAKGVDSGFTFVDRASVRLDADAAGRVSYAGKTIALALDSGNVEGQALVRYGLKISDANGFVTVWKGAKVRVESLAEGLRVCVLEGKVRVENEHGHCVLREGSEALVTADKAPRASPGHGGGDHDRKTPAAPHGK